MLSNSTSEPFAEPVAAPVARDPLPPGRALAEVILCSGYPTQLLAAAGLALSGIGPGTAGTLTPLFVFSVSAVDTVLLLGLILWLLRRSGDRPRALFLGTRPLAGEIGFGVAILPLVVGTVIAVQLIIQSVAPTLRNVHTSPFQALLGSPWLLAGFVVLVVVAGGLREELQRAFLLNRFERRLGGALPGVIVTSVAFGLGHTVQGWDAAIVTGLLGAMWGIVYLQRRSVVATVTSHALFNLGQVAGAYAMLARGG